MKEWYCSYCDFYFLSDSKNYCPICGKETIQIKDNKIKNCENGNCHLEY
jgi:rubrerythrin